MPAQPDALLLNLCWRKHVLKYFTRLQHGSRRSHHDSKHCTAACMEPRRLHERSKHSIPARLVCGWQGVLRQPSIDPSNPLQYSVNFIENWKIIRPLIATIWKAVMQCPLLFLLACSLVAAFPVHFPVFLDRQALRSIDFHHAAHLSNQRLERIPRSAELLFTASDDDEISHVWLPLGKRLHTSTSDLPMLLDCDQV